MVLRISGPSFDLMYPCRSVVTGSTMLTVLESTKTASVAGGAAFGKGSEAFLLYQFGSQASMTNDLEVVDQIRFLV
jgi:hypothetical protein